jgi:PAS domain S-box-containing protein
MKKKFTSHRSRLLLLALIMVTVAITSAGFWGFGLYHAAVQEQRAWLVKLVQSQSHLISTVAKFDSEHISSDHPGGAWGATMSQIEAASDAYREFGKTGEFVLGRQQDNQIIFLLKRRFSDRYGSNAVAFTSTLAEPMHKALSGLHGTIIGPDYRNVQVLAAYEPIKGTDIGIVAKIDISEIRAPFFKYGGYSAAGALVIIFIGVAIGGRVTAPVIKHLETAVENLEATQRLTHLGNWEWNIKQGTLEWSEELYRISGQDPQTIFPSYDHFFEIIHPNDVDRVKAVHQKALKDKAVFDFGFRIIRPDGSIRYINEQGEVFQNSQGEPIRMLGTVRDITERKRSDALLKQAVIETKAANNAKSEFLASMSHDLRTPLNAIMGFAEMMKERTYGPLGNKHYEDYAGIIHDSGKLLVNLINDILDISKIEAGKYALNKENIVLGELIETTMKMVTPQARSKNLVLSHQTGIDLPKLYADQRAITQVLSNMLSNAVKFTPEGGRISVEAQLSTVETLEILICDTGIGMSDEDIKKAIRPFEQADSLHSRHHEGTGLGIHLSKNLMDLHGGNLEIRSQIGVGTTITLSFPRALLIDYATI